LEIDLGLIGHNARVLVRQLSPLGIGVCGVTKATMGSPEVARELLAAGVSSLGESRIENVERLRLAGITGPIMLIRSPMISQADRVVASADVSLNSEIDVIDRLSNATRRLGRSHGVVLMVELGDLREGIMPGDLADTVRTILRFPGIELRGIGSNLACQSGVIPDNSNMAELSALATSIEETFGLHLDIVSGGNSANLPWALGPQADIGRVNHLRLGESVLLGREPIHRSILDDLRADAISIVGEVIESKVKPGQPRGSRGQNAFGIRDDRHPIRRQGHRVIVALGRQDLDTDGIAAPADFELLGASSDHLVLDSGATIPEVGSELRFALNYSALMSSMASPFVTRRYVRNGNAQAVPPGDRPCPSPSTVVEGSQETV
jgi:predicted amino acid racemase